MSNATLSTLVASILAILVLGVTVLSGAAEQQQGVLHGMECPKADGISVAHAGGRTSTSPIGCPSLKYTFMGQYNGSLGDQLGRSVDDAGDVDGDGYSDIIVGIPGHEVLSYQMGGGVVVFSGLTGEPIHTLYSDTTRIMTGSIVTGVGDLNGDTHADFLISELSNGTSGRVLAISGLTADTLHELVVSPGYVQGMASLGDLDNDSVPDFAVANSDGNLGGGSIVIYSGQAGSVIRTIDSPCSGCDFPRWLDAAGDVNGDGYVDIIASMDADGYGAKYVYIFSGLDGQLLFTYSSGPTGPNFFAQHGAISGAGDVNGDGFDDIVIGHREAGPDSTGRAYVFLGNSVGASLTLEDAYYVFEGLPFYATKWTFGSVVAEAGDLNADGFEDVAVGASSQFSNVHELYVFSGIDGSVLEWIADSSAPYGIGGNQISIVFMDIDSQDMATELVVGFPQDNTNGWSAGRADVYSFCLPDCRVYSVSWMPGRPLVYTDGNGMCHVEVVECEKYPESEDCNFSSYPQAVNIFFELDDECLSGADIDSVHLVPDGMTGQVFDLTGTGVQWSLYFIITNLVTPDDYNLVLYHQDASETVIERVLHYEGYSDPNGMSLKGSIAVGGTLSPAGDEYQQAGGAPVSAAQVTVWKWDPMQWAYQLIQARYLIPSVNPYVTTGRGFVGWNVADGQYKLDIAADGFDPVTTEIMVPPGVIDTLLVPIATDLLPPQVTVTYVESSEVPLFQVLALDAGIGIGSVEFLYDSTATLHNVMPEFQAFVSGGDSATLLVLIIDPSDTSFFDLRVTDVYGNITDTHVSGPGGGCCSDITGNVNNDPGDNIDISDLVYMVDYMFTSGPPPECDEEADINSSGTLDISDLVYMVDYMFTGGPPPPSCP